MTEKPKKGSSLEGPKFRVMKKVKKIKKGGKERLVLNGNREKRRGLEEGQP